MKERPNAGQEVPERYIETHRGSQKLKLDEVDRKRRDLETELHQRVREVEGDEDRVRKLLAEYQPELDSLDGQIRALEKDVYDIDTEK